MGFFATFLTGVVGCLLVCGVEDFTSGFWVVAFLTVDVVFFLATGLLSGGASSGATGGGVQVIEKDGQVQIAPEVNQRCYWRPKAKTPTESKPVAKKEDHIHC